MGDATTTYRGRLAPSPTGYLHLGHVRTFWTAWSRARESQGALVLRSEDLDRPRCKAEFQAAMIEDLRWFGFAWEEGPDRGGPCGPYCQSARLELYLEVLRRLLDTGLIYPCVCSRQDVIRASQAPHADEEEPIYPGTCRPGTHTNRRSAARGWAANLPPFAPAGAAPGRTNWRFQVPDGETITFCDGAAGWQSFVAGSDFGDFVVWRHDGVPAYQLAVVVDDAAMGITEVVRGMDLLPSTARQLLLYRALGYQAPAFFHCPLVTDEAGVRLAKRHDALSLRRLRAEGHTPEGLRAGWREGR
jgi:glutamyl/glutaminyl-tRNA synthetase